MAISRIDQGAASGTSATFGTNPSARDLILVFAYRTANTAPTLPAGYTSVATSSGNSNSMRCGYKVAVGTETTTGTWTNATYVAYGIYRGNDIAPVGGSANTNTTATTTLTFPTVTLQRGDNTSWMVGFNGHTAATAGLTNAPTGMTNQASAGTSGGVTMSDTNGTVSSWTVQTTSVTTSGNTRGCTVEIRASVAATTSPSQLVQHHFLRPNRDDGGGTDAAATYLFPWIHPTLSGNLLIVRLSYPYSAGRTVSVTDDAGNTYTADKTQNDTTNVFTTAIFSKANATTGATKVTVVFDAAIHAVCASLTELSGMAQSSHVETSTGSSTAVDPEILAGSISPSVETIIVQSAFMDATSTGLGYNKCSGLAAGNGYALLGATRETLILDQCKVQSAATVNPACSALLTGGGPGQNWLTAAVAYKTDAGKGTARPTGSVRVLRAIHTTSADAGLETTADTFECPGDGDFAAVMSCFTSTQANFSSLADTGAGSWTVPTHSADYSQIGYSYNRTADLTRRVTLTLSSAYAMNLCLIDAIGIQTGSDPYVGKTEATDSQTVANENLTPLPTRTPAATGNLFLLGMNEGHGPVSAISAPSGAVCLNSHYTGTPPNAHTDTSSADDSGDGYGFYIAADTSSKTFTWTSAVPNWPVTISRVGTTATAVHDAAYSTFLTNGDSVHIQGADQADYNGVKVIAGVGGTDFTYTVSGSPATPATGTITATQLTDAQGTAWEFSKAVTADTQEWRGTFPPAKRTTWPNLSY